MTALAALLTVTMAAIALLHFYWAVGGLWPGRSRAELAAIVVGRPRMEEMPSTRLTMLVASLLAGAALWPLVLAPFINRNIAPQLAMAGTLLLATLFLLRGLAGYMPLMTQRHSAEPFARYNRIFYSPLCLLLSLGFLIFTSNGVPA
jgi:hypothetical protein